MASHRHKSSSDTQYKTAYPPTTVRSFTCEWQKSSADADKAAKTTQEKAQNFYDQYTHNLSELQVGNHVAIQNPTSKLWEIYGVISIFGPHRQYLICQDTKRMNSSQKQTLLTQTKPNFNCNPCSKQTPHTLEPTTTIEPRRSSRVKYPSRLSQDPAWGSSVVLSEELGGDTINYIPGVMGLDLVT